MSSKKNPSSNLKTLSQQEETAPTTSRVKVKKMSLHEIQQLLHGLQVHQNELEMQNEELRRAQIDLQRAHDRYAELYEFSPVGFFTLNVRGEVLSANLTACQFLTVERKALIHQKLEAFVIADDQPILRRYFHRIGQGHTIEISDVIQLKTGHSAYFVQQKSLYADGDDPSADTRFCLAIIDVTEKERIKQTLVDAQTISHQVFESSPDHISVIGHDYCYRQVNHAYEVAHGLSQKEIVGVHISTLLGEEVFQKIVKPHFDRALAGETVRYESWFNFQAMGQRFMAVTYAPLREGNRQIDSIVVTIRDLTDRKLADEALMKSKAQRQLAMGAAKVGTWTWDVTTNEVVWSQNVEELFGLPLGAFAGTYQAYLDLVHPSDLRAVNDAVRKTVNHNEPYDIEHRIIWPDGGTHWVSCRGNIVGNQSTGEPFLLAGTVVDVTERRQYQEALKKEQQFIAKILDTADALVVVLDPEWRIVRLNRVCEDLIGRNIEEMRGRSFLDLSVVSGEDDSAVKKLFDSFKGQEFPEFFENAWVRHDRKLCWIRWSNTVITDKEGKTEYIIATGIDITERKQAEEAERIRTESIIRHQMGLLKLAQMDHSNLDLAIQKITETDSSTLGVNRVSVWLFSEDRSEIVCEDLYKGKENVHEKGLRLCANQYPNYFKALEENRVLAADMAQVDPRTNEFTDRYLKPLGVTSMMDAPIWVHGKVIGIVCHEHTDPPREWTFGEQDFAASIAGMASLVFVAEERKQAEQALQENTNFLQSVLHSTDEGIISLNSQGLVVLWNKGAETLFGFSSDDMVGQSLTRIMSERFRQAHQDRIKRAALAGKKTVAGDMFELIGLRKDGTEFPLELSLGYWQKAGETFFTGIVRDITERKQAEQEIQRLSIQNTLILNSAGEGIYGLDVQGRVTFFNQAAQRLTGWKLEDVQGKVVYPILHHSKADGTPYLQEECSIYSSLKDGTVHHQVLTEVFWRRDGTYFPTEYTSTPILDEGNQIKGVVVTFRDISERHRNENLLRGQQQVLEMISVEKSLAEIFERICRFVEELDRGSICSIYLYDCMTLRVGAAPSLPVSYVQALEGILRSSPEGGSCGTAAYRKEQVIVSDIATDPLWKQFRKLASEHGLHACWSTPILSKSDTVLGVLGVYHRQPQNPEATDFALMDLSCRLAGVALDRHLAQTALRTNREELQALGGQLISAQEDERRRISRELHDDMNQRLAVLALNIQSAQKGLGASSPMYQVLQKLYDGVSSLSDDVRNLAYQLHPSILDDLGLEVAIKSFLNDFSKWEGIPIAFTSTDITGSLPQEIASCLYRVTQECLRNIVRHAQATQVQVTLTGHIGDLKLSIKDNGKGFKIEEKRSGKAGLGLIGMQERVRVVQGIYGVQSVLGQGTEVTVCVPRREAESKK